MNFFLALASLVSYVPHATSFRFLPFVSFTLFAFSLPYVLKNFRVLSLDSTSTCSPGPAYAILKPCITPRHHHPSSLGPIQKNGKNFCGHSIERQNLLSSPSSVLPDISPAALSILFSLYSDISFPLGPWSALVGTPSPPSPGRCGSCSKTHPSRRMGLPNSTFSFWALSNQRI